MILWLRRIVVTLVVVLAVVLLWRGLLIAVGLVALPVVAAYVGDRWRKWHAVRRFRVVWRPKGKDVLLVYSNSPHWQRYVEENWMPRWGHRAVVLNWSERSGWKGRALAEVTSPALRFECSSGQEGQGFPAPFEFGSEELLMISVYTPPRPLALDLAAQLEAARCTTYGYVAPTNACRDRRSPGRGPGVALQRSGSIAFGRGTRRPS